LFSISVCRWLNDNSLSLSPLAHAALPPRVFVYAGSAAGIHWVFRPLSLSQYFPVIGAVSKGDHRLFSRLAIFLFSPFLPRKAAVIFSCQAALGFVGNRLQTLSCTSVTAAQTAPFLRFLCSFRFRGSWSAHIFPSVFLLQEDAMFEKKVGFCRFGFSQLHLVLMNFALFFSFFGFRYDALLGAGGMERLLSFCPPFVLLPSLIFLLNFYAPSFLFASLMAPLARR